MPDLWGFKKIDKSDLQGTPHGLLKEQADFFDKKTDDYLYARLKNRKLPSAVDDKYYFATNFDIVAPQLDGYSYTLLTIYSMPESDFPVAISNNSTKKEEWEIEDYDHTCNNEKEFVEVIKEILQSQETMSIIRNLYSKSSY
ncbi:hypothetical protein P4647_08270 [Peribacillus frigoritolerans]|uniref:hypothetical protein n=1 Tax=Peribacillus frigoritolerans TaxID=450367 RepID=UPI002E214D55|nr:hypothetical protein [Peribacillus frigoritolerans]